MALFLAWHLGLGDALICNGLVRKLCELHDTVTVPSKYHNVPTVKHMFSDLDQVHVMPVNGDKEMLWHAARNDSLRLGLHSKEGLRRVGWDRQFYEQAGVSFEERWIGFQVPSIPQEKVAVADYCFVHQDPTRGFTIDKRRLPQLPRVEPHRTPTLFGWMDALANAQEIHCIDSCFAILADSIPCKADRYVLHLYARNDNRPSYRKNWTVLK